MEQDSKKIENVIGDYRQFLDNVFYNINQVRIDITNYELDHIAYRATTKDSYSKILGNICPLFGILVKKVIIRNREIAIIKLTKPLRYKDKTITFVELMEPADNDKFPEGLEHAEFVVNKGIEKLKKEYPTINFLFIQRKINPELILKFKNGANIKFHNSDIEKVLKLQELAGEL